MLKKNMWLILTVISGIVLFSIYMSNITGKTEYAWIIGSTLFGIGCESRYNVSKRDRGKS